MSRAKKIALAVLIGVPLLSGVSAIGVYLFPTWPLRLVASVALPRINAAIAGEIEIDTLEAATLASIELRGVRVRDGDGTEVLELPGLVLEWHPLALAEQRVSVQSLEFEAPRVDLTAGDDGGSRLTQAFSGTAPPTPATTDRPSDAPLPVSVAVDSFSVVDGELRLPDGSTLPFEMTATASLSRDGSWSGRGEVIHREDTVHFEGDALALTGESGRAMVVARVSEQTLSTLDPNIRCPAEVELTASRADAAAPWTIRATVENEVVRLKLRSRFAGGFAHQHSEIDFEADAPDRCYAGAPPGRGAGEASARGPLEAIRASVPALHWQYNEIDARGSIDEVLVQPHRVRVEGLEVRVGEDRIAADAELDPRAVLAPGGFARIDIVLRDFERFRELSPVSIAGSLESHVDLRMEESLRGSATLRARNLVFDTLGPLDVDGTLEGDVDRVQARLDARPRSGTGGRMRAVASARVAPLRERATLESFLDSTRAELTFVDVEPTEWAALDGLEPWRANGRVAWDGTRLDGKAQVNGDHSELGPLAAVLALRGNPEEVRATVDADRENGGTLALKLATTSSLRRLLQADPSALDWRIEARVYALEWAGLEPWLPEYALAGPLELDANLTLAAGRPAGTIALVTDVTSIRPKLPPVNLRLATRLSPGALDTTLDLSGPLVAHLEARTPMPERLDDFATIGVERLLSTHATFSLRVDALERFRGQAGVEPLEGELDVEGSYRNRTFESELGFDVRRIGAGIPPVRGTIRARVAEGSELTADLEVAGGALALGATSPFAFDTLLGESIEPPPVAIELTLTELQLDGLLARASLPRSTAGVLSGRTRLRYEDRSVTGDGMLQVYGGILGGAVLRDARIDFGLDQRRAQLTVDIATGRRGELRLALAHPLADATGTELELTAREFSLSWVREITAALGRSEFVDGRLDADLTVRISQTGTSLDGDLTLSRGTARVAGQLPLLRDVQLDAHFHGARSTFDLMADAAGGTIALHASEASLSAGRLKGELLVDRVPLSIDRLTLRTSTDIGVDATINSSGADVKTEIRGGRIVVVRLDSIGLHSTEELKYVRYVDDEPATTDAVTRIEEDSGVVRVEVRTLEPVVISGELAQTSLEVDLAALRRASAVGLDGTVRLLGGSAKVGPHRYQIERAVVAFSGQRTPNPTLDVSLLKEFSEPPTSFYVRVSGTATEPRVRFESDPSVYDQSQLVGFFAGGNPGDTSGDVDARAVAGVAAGLLTSQLQSELQEALPVDTIEIDVGENGESASLTTGKWLSADLFVAYRVGVSNDNSIGSNAGPSSTGILHYRLTPRWTLEMQVKPGEQGSGSADLVWVKRF